jgi:hypothetical protein
VSGDDAVSPRFPVGVRGARARALALLGVLSGASAAPMLVPPSLDPSPPDLRLFFEAASADEKQARAALDRIAASWKDGYAPLLVDLARFMRSAPGPGPSADETLSLNDGDTRGLGAGGTPRSFPESAASGPPPPSARVRARLVRFLERQTGQRFGDDLRRWRRWYWSRPYDPHPDYAAFKAALYGRLDPQMADFFPPGARELVRLDEVDWGGVGVDGIPPLDHPRHVPAREARYLKDKHVVFGVFLNGEARAYPKRILSWHELVRDRLGGVELALVYCTLCGTVIPYGAEVGGTKRTFGTSGLLYRSNKLMFDEESRSLWSTVEGRPVLGRLAGESLTLEAHPVVTTSFKEWREAHPETTVLSLETGHERDYGEGVAYREYFASDELMFEVPRTDGRLKNKEEVLALLVEPAGGGVRHPVALSSDFLRKNRVYPLEVAGRSLLVLTSPEGANRVYNVTGARPLRLRPDGLLEADGGLLYRVGEDGLVPEGSNGAPLPRVSARRAFWFGWQAEFPDTVLVK